MSGCAQSAHLRNSTVHMKHTHRLTVCPGLVQICAMPDRDLLEKRVADALRLHLVERNARLWSRLGIQPQMPTVDEFSDSDQFRDEAREMIAAYNTALAEANLVIVEATVIRTTTLCIKALKGVAAAARNGNMLGLDDDAFRSMMRKAEELINRLNRSLRFKETDHLR